MPKVDHGIVRFNYQPKLIRSQYRFGPILKTSRLKLIFAFLSCNIEFVKWTVRIVKFYITVLSSTDSKVVEYTIHSEYVREFVENNLWNYLEF